MKKRSEENVFRIYKRDPVAGESEDYRFTTGLKETLEEVAGLNQDGLTPEEKERGIRFEYVIWNSR